MKRAYQKVRVASNFILLYLNVEENGKRTSMGHVYCAVEDVWVMPEGKANVLTGQGNIQTK